VRFAASGWLGKGGRYGRQQKIPSVYGKESRCDEEPTGDLSVVVCRSPPPPTNGGS
jgi:hypothetical protein